MTPIPHPKVVAVGRKVEVKVARMMPTGMCGDYTATMSLKTLSDVRRHFVHGMFLNLAYL
jgi:hypothetical protein